MTLPDSTNDLGGIEFGSEQPDWFMDLQERQREAGQSLTEAVAKAVTQWLKANVGEHDGDESELVATIIAAVRRADEQAALNCGHCDPNTDEIACACQIKERDDE